MRRLALALLLLVESGAAAEGLDGLRDAGTLLTSAERDPARAVAEADGGWLALSIPVQAGSDSPCCWQGRWDRPEARECRLDDGRQSHGTRAESPPTRLLRLFAQVRQAQVTQLLLAGPDCPVNAAGARVTVLPSVGEEATGDWLEQLARAGVEDLSHQAMFALSMAEGEAALTRMERIARDDRDPQLRADALFWLAQSHPERARPLLQEVLQSAPRGAALERTMFAVSQLGDDSGDELLFEIARDPGRPDPMRRQAFFWLAQSESDQTLDQLIELLTSRRTQPQGGVH